MDDWGKRRLKRFKLNLGGNSNECYSLRRKVKANMSTQSRQTKFFKLLEPHIDRGVQLLTNEPVLFANVKNCLPITLKSSYAGLSPADFMEKLTSDLLFQTTDPSGLNDFDGVVKRLPPLGEIKKIVCDKEFKDSVNIEPRNVINDRRIPLKEFRQGLSAYLHRDKSAEKKADSENLKSRRIMGFAPQPDDQKSE
jgi:hypothetical protein